jgi:hypothetical protein
VLAEMRRPGVPAPRRDDIVRAKGWTESMRNHRGCNPANNMLTSLASRGERWYGDDAALSDTLEPKQLHRVLDWLCCPVLETFEQRLLAEVANALGDTVMDEMVDASLKAGDRATRSLVRRKACELRLRPARA